MECGGRCVHEKSATRTASSGQYHCVFIDPGYSTKKSARHKVLCRQVFQNGKTLPIDRGGGVHQPIMEVTAKRAADGDWVHIFPEAKIGYSGQLQTVKRGIGKLVCDCVRDGGR